MGMFDAFNVNASGLTAQRYRMDVISQNVANANTTRTEDGTPYVRKIVTFEEKQGSFGTFSSVFGSASERFKSHGVKVSGTYEDKSLKARWYMTHLIRMQTRTDMLHTRM